MRDFLNDLAGFAVLLAVFGLGFAAVVGVATAAEYIVATAKQLFG
jgi:hypothetical protein